MTYFIKIKTVHLTILNEYICVLDPEFAMSLMIWMVYYWNALNETLKHGREGRKTTNIWCDDSYYTYVDQKQADYNLISSNTYMNMETAIE